MAFIPVALAAVGTALGASAATATTTGLAALSAATTVIGTGVSALGAMQQGNAQKAAADYNAKVERVQAQNVQNQAQAQAQQQDQANRRRMGEAAAAYGAAGVDMEGSPLSVMMDLGAQGELSKRLILYKGTVDAQSAMAQAGIDTATGQNAATAGLTKAGGTLLTGFGNTAQKLQPLFSNPSPNPTGAGTSPLTVQ